MYKMCKKTVDKTDFCGTIIKHPGVAQVVARQFRVLEAASSSPATSTKKKRESNGLSLLFARGGHYLFIKSKIDHINTSFDFSAYSITHIPIKINPHYTK